MAIMATNRVPVAMGQVETSFPRSNYSFFPTKLFLVIMTRFYFSLCMQKVM